MALFVRRLNQSSFHDTSLRPSQDEAFAETIPLGYYNRSLEVDQSSEETSRMVIHADFQGRYDHVFEKAPASRDQRPMPSHASSSTSRSSAIVPNASCRDPSMSPSPAPSLQWQEFHTSTAPEGRPEFYRTASKRRRSIHDVDGPHTGSLGCKKRRLRRELITSRLSRPFSSPATHILNREAAAGGKRFLKMAAAAAARKVTSVVIPTPPPTDWDLGTKVAAAQVATVIPANNIHPLAPAEMVRRAAIMNRFRIRVCDEARQRGDRTDLEMTASAALLRASTGHHGVGFVADPRASVRRTPADSRPNSRLQQTMSTLSTPSTTTSASRWATTSGTVVSRRAEPQQPSHNYRTSRSSSPGSPSKAVRPLDSRCPSPRLRPLRSPERPAVRNQDLNSAVDDDQLLTFSATDYSDDFADPDDGEIYTDFSLIFGGSGGEMVATDSERDPVEYSSGADEHFEDYMDDLDGIPWDAR